MKIYTALNITFFKQGLNSSLRNISGFSSLLLFLNGMALAV
ncbi:hypothetical protein BTN49_2982 [Candidatus Enterovibrio escicola]|uniref:Uncharacterized protein n=1 Tax=Candidatus Enterovibrio escicola TaxID=1927127 RepID=A0A2A5SZV3_9GAMM|nr:hypothetical protein BTN49_2982 [Candidatus Enterovibrio escacola]